MSVRSHQIQALFARRREIEHDRIERTAAVNRYYDHWGKVTTRFENWTKPEYYKNAEEQLKQRRETREKEMQQLERRERLRELFEKEKMLYEREMLERERPRSRKIAATTEQLEKIEQSAKERENIKRKLDLEAKLYGRWRHGVDDDNVLFESKSSNETLAKLNWLDKKIEEQYDREREEAQSLERNLRLQEGISRTEQVQRERQLIREKEIKEIRELQETHMQELKMRQTEADSLKEEEKHLRTCLSDLDKEVELLEESCSLIMESADVSQAYNLKKIKIFIRKRSESFCNQIKLCISILERLSVYTTCADVKRLLNKYRGHLEAESVNLTQVEAMYESEAKYNMQRLESLWQQQHLERYHELKQLLTEERCTFGARINENLQRQTDTYEVRSTHLTALENSNEKLKQLIAEEQQSPRSALPLAKSSDSAPPFPGTEYSGDAGDQASVADDNVSIAQLMPSGIPSRPTTGTHFGRRRPTSSQLPKVTNSFTNLNLDVWKDLPAARHGIDSPRLVTQRSPSIVTSESATRPKFARKRIAWT
nr:trichoplein keratin filament-binding protein [Bactrocera oleae]XP_014091175.2 trichoplein keratin filament-binding protein [Bactrocera oleae]XP_014091177.2 trichoplein keratin filament-binding protein [Bactrocera oleae]XP_036233243.1 trichoplein keratin filament-binding protein [Bactrocera oleae]XP_036233244.1 trichoplein keratin filament-binding protein [Bactrocera oleae]XP_036233245.1 trichoplein keratin filament-binding protein [Bactrocera oleae]XP_036233246.1 trichoplein keratin filame